MLAVVASLWVSDAAGLPPHIPRDHLTGLAAQCSVEELVAHRAPRDGALNLYGRAFLLAEELLARVSVHAVRDLAIGGPDGSPMVLHEWIHRHPEVQAVPVSENIARLIEVAEAERSAEVA